MTCGSSSRSWPRMVALDEHAVVGRYAIDSEAGGAVWAFQSSGKLIVTGPADLMAEGQWTSAPGSGSRFDASLDVTVTSQQLEVLGEVSPGGREVALYVAASPPDDQQNAVPWPPESRLVGRSLGLIVEPTPAASIDSMECLRPAWRAGGSVDWEPCGSGEAPQATELPATESSVAMESPAATESSVAMESPAAAEPSVAPSPLP